MGAFAAVYEDEDDWLVGYLATTEYGADTRINSNPTGNTVKKEKTSKPLYNLSLAMTSGNSRRKSWAAPDARSKGGRKSFQNDASSLPERVTAVRDAAFVPGGNMVVRDHGKAEVHEAGKRPSLEEDEEAWADAELAKVRRQSLDYDELEAVKERVTQATSIWKKTDNPTKLDQVAPTQLATFAKAVEAEPTRSLKQSASGKNWLFSKWMSKFGGQKARTG